MLCLKAVGRYVNRPISTDFIKENDFRFKLDGNG